MRKVVAALGLAGLILLSAGCSDGGLTPEPRPSVSLDKTATVPVSQPLTLDSTLLGDRSEIVVTVRSARVSTTGSHEFDKPRGEYVVVDIVIECKAGKYHANPFNFGIVSRDGTKGTPTTSMFPPALESVDLKAGAQVSGTVVFDVPKGASKGARIAVRDTLGARDIGYWTL
ncbi:DUF4352 domain-containing protein [Longispora sp. NPDC051575]|uniref:DUF4352 domain-containing protein n=1 Tax=Longispora sp. NPDC051575 TaxID=3154943 RepID=UPI00342EF7C0